jgi:short-subunit dehydrogenase
MNVLVTGASSGLGRGLALHYARGGATVHAIARRAAELRALEAEASSAGAAGRVVPVTLDVQRAEALAGAIAAAESASGGALDLVIANAGVGDPTPGDRIDWRTVHRVLDVNASGACVTIAAALPAMVARGQGTVVAVSSLAAFRGLPGTAAYCASKAALHAFMESLRVDLRGTGVRAITLYPGFVRTAMSSALQSPKPFLMELDDAVRVMAERIDRGDPAVAFPFPLAAMVRVLHALPRVMYEPLAGRVRVGTRP